MAKPSHQPFSPQPYPAGDCPRSSICIKNETINTKFVSETLGENEVVHHSHSEHNLESGKWINTKFFSLHLSCWYQLETALRKKRTLCKRAQTTAVFVRILPEWKISDCTTKKRWTRLGTWAQFESVPLFGRRICFHPAKCRSAGFSPWSFLSPKIKGFSLPESSSE